MAMKYRVAERGERTIYVDHGVWYDANTKHIHVTVPGHEGAHWSYGKSDEKYAMYRAMVEETGRWPENAD
ncbi:hypothetical protein GCM10023216_02690 [Isoptericola chiayiensis]|uniref:Uncharacterized protein n=1 Tax=Isoptericola chiayiensis TaxID=579446 RepID=A0ABP8XYA8_9MICO|nr:hypothetical protein [Isoptericola chiayiensis]NOW01087.1 hypothetical protein [Isoptericola chiayiensis]